MMLLLSSGKAVNAFVHKSRVPQNFWKAWFLLGSSVLAQLVVSAAALLPRSSCGTVPLAGEEGMSVVPANTINQ